MVAGTPGDLPVGWPGSAMRVGWSARVAVSLSCLCLILLVGSGGTMAEPQAPTPLQGRVSAVALRVEARLLGGPGRARFESAVQVFNLGDVPLDGAWLAASAHDSEGQRCAWLRAPARLQALPRGTQVLRAVTGELPDVARSIEIGVYAGNDSVRSVWRGVLTGGALSAVPAADLHLELSAPASSGAVWRNLPYSLAVSNPAASATAQVVMEAACDGVLALAWADPEFTFTVQPGETYMVPLPVMADARGVGEVRVRLRTGTSRSEVLIGGDTGAWSGHAHSPAAGDWLRNVAEPMARPATLTQFMNSHLKGVRLVGLGDPSHGTKEYPALAESVLTHLAQEGRLGVVFLELDPQIVDRLWARATGATPGDERASDAWESAHPAAQVAAVLRALRQRSHSGTIGEQRPVGIDVPRTLAVISPVIARLRAASLWSASDDAWFGALSNLWEGEIATLGPPRLVRVARERLQRLERVLAYSTQLEASRGVSSDLERVRAARQCLLVYGEEGPAASAARFQRRELCMLENVLQGLRSAPTAATSVLLAHNAHVGRQGLPMIRPLGAELAARLGPEYFVCASLFVQGSTLTHWSLGAKLGGRPWSCELATVESSNSMVILTFGPPPPGSVEALAASVLGADCLVPIRVPGTQESAYRAGFSETLLVRQVGGSTNCAEASRLFPIELATAYDALFFFMSVSPATPEFGPAR